MSSQDSPLFSISEELKKLPGDPGVYIMRDRYDAVIYVGKAKNLKNRVSQYFRKSHDEGIKKNQMVTIIERFEYIITDTEMEALVLENNLIKEYRPKYNTLLRDDKTYPYIKITLGEKYPRIYSVRRVAKDGARYFGPFTSAKSVKDTIELLQKICFIRTCSNNFSKSQGKVKSCLNYHIKQCKGVCQGLISEEEYSGNVERAIKFLEGDYAPIEKMLTEKMQEKSRAMEFEEAAFYRDLIESVKFCIQKQKITYSDQDDRDIIAIAAQGTDAVAQVFFIRDGRMIGRDNFSMSRENEEERNELYSAFINQYYSGTPYIPHEIFIQDEIEDREIVEEWLSGKRGKKVYIRTPKRGQKEKLVELAEKNAKLILSQGSERIKREEGRTIGAVKEIASLLGIEHIHRMEAYDISNTSGFASVGSMVVFENGKPKRADYRKFKIKSVQGPDDYSSMKEVLTRRFLHGMEDEKKGAMKNSFTRFPDLILMDGGKGQVNIALGVLKELGLSAPVCGMVKDDRHNTRGLYYNGSELPIDKKSEGFKLITRVQDEAHRFAIEFHRSLRGKAQVKSFLEDIPGIGDKRRKALMRAFTGVSDMREADIDSLMSVPSMDRKSAEAVYNYLHSAE